MTPKRLAALPLQRRETGAVPAVDALEQSVRRLADLVLGATAFADRLQQLSALRDPTEDAAVSRARTERITQLRAFASWGRAAIARAAVDDAYAERMRAGRAPRAPHA